MISATTVTKNINLTQIEDQIAALLYAQRQVNETDTIRNMTFGAPIIEGNETLVPLTFDVVKEGGDKKK